MCGHAKVAASWLTSGGSWSSGPGLLHRRGLTIALPTPLKAAKSLCHHPRAHQVHSHCRAGTKMPSAVLRPPLTLFQLGFDFGPCREPVAAWLLGAAPKGRPSGRGVFSGSCDEVLFVAILFVIYGFHAAHYDTMDIRRGLRLLRSPRTDMCFRFWHPGDYHHLVDLLEDDHGQCGGRRDAA